MNLKLCAALCALVTASCPKRFDPTTTPEVPTHSSEARARFAEARERLDHEDFAAAAQGFDAVARDYAGDPIAPVATLYAGIASYRSGDYTAAAGRLSGLADETSLAEDVRARARFYLGLSDGYLGKTEEARALLEPYAGKVGGADEGELRAVLAEAAAGQGDAEGALPHYEAWFAQARPAERVYILARVAGLVDGLSPEAAGRAYGRADRGGVAAAFLGRRVAATLSAGGDEEGAARVLADTAAARARAGLSEAGGGASPSGPGDPQVVGAVLPLSGKRRLIGEASLRGLAVAAGTFDRVPAAGVRKDHVPAPFELVVRDAGEGKGKAAAAVDELTAQGAIALVGPIDKEAAEEAQRRAEALGVPLLALDVSESGAAGSPHVFHVVVSVEQRARALAAHAHAQGARTFAILAPEIAYGTRAADAFARAVVEQGDRVVARQSYGKEATGFVGPVAKLAAQPFDALFVPDTAARLELIAPQLAASDLVVQPASAKPPRRGRPIMLLSTAEAVTAKFARGSGRYTVGAVLAPGFYPDAADPRSGSYVARFRAAYGEDPTYLDAYAYDAALLVREAVESGSQERDAVGAHMAGLSAGRPLAGLTGDIYFDAGRARADRGVLYVVTPDAGGHAIRAVRP